MEDETVSIHYGPTDKYPTSLLLEGGFIQNGFDWSILYAISSSLSGGVRSSIKLQS